MKNPLFRRAAVGTFAAAAAIGLSTFFVTPASAHSAGPAGSADCGDNGLYTVTWTVKNDFNKPVTLSNIKITPNAGNGNVPGEIKLDGGAGSSFKTTYAGDAKTELILSVDGLWQDGPRKTWPEDGHPKTFHSDPVKLKGDCKPTGTSPKPSPSPSRSASKPPTPEASRPVTPTPSQSSTPGLPVTGSSTTLPMVGTGAALVAGGAALVFTLRRRRRVTFTAE